MGKLGMLEMQCGAGMAASQWIEEAVVVVVVAVAAELIRLFRVAGFRVEGRKWFLHVHSYPCERTRVATHARAHAHAHTQAHAKHANVRTQWTRADIRKDTHIPRIGIV